MGMVIEEIDLGLGDDPNLLFKWFSDNVTYGWLDSENNKHDFYTHNEDLNFINNTYRLLMPHEVAKYKIGTCWDQTLFLYHMLTKYYGLNAKMVFIQVVNASNHSFVVFERDGEWFYFENIFNKIKGIHGPISSIKDPLDLICNEMTENTELKNLGYTWSYLNYDKMTEKTMTMQDFFFMVISAYRTNNESLSELGK